MASARRRRRAGRMHRLARRVHQAFPEANPGQVACVARGLVHLLAQAHMARRSLLGLLRLTADVLNVFDATFEVAREIGLAHAHLACQAGCAFCCQVRVQASPLEVCVLACWIEASFDAQARVRLITALEEVTRRTHGVTTSERPMVVCPLLADRLCSAYPARPLACRGATSLDARACERAFGTPGGAPPPDGTIALDVFGYVLGFALSNTLLTARRSSKRLDLHAALAIALTTPQAGARWFAGEDVFAAAAHWRGRDQD